MKRSNNGMAGIILIAVLVVMSIPLLMYFMPIYNQYSKEMRGKAALKEAEWSKKIQIEDARAKEEAALMTAEARITLSKAKGQAMVIEAEAENQVDILRAKATAEANKIIGESLKGNSEYLRYLWIKNIQSEYGERIYIPTEAGLPILEAGQLSPLGQK